MRLIKIHSPNDKRRILVYDNGSVVEISIGFCASISVEEYGHGERLQDNQIKIEENHIKINNKTQSKMTSITDNSSFYIQCSSDINRNMCDIKYRLHAVNMSHKN